MLVATWMVRIVKTVTEVLKMLPRRGEAQASGRLFKPQFSTIPTDHKLANDISIFFSCGNLTYKWVRLFNFVIGLTHAPSTNHSQKLQQANRAPKILEK